jgi:ornithine carbamoyltransferase
MTTVLSPARVRHFTRVADLEPHELSELLDLAAMLKAHPEREAGALQGEAIACIFEKPSTRTRVSFAAAIARLGAAPVALSPQELQLGRGESIADTARSLSGYVSAIVIRTAAHERVDELARWATVPVVNALSDEHHPCQALADLLTIEETFGGVSGRRLAFVGDGRDNVAHSLLEIGALAGLNVTIPASTSPLPAFSPTRATSHAGPAPGWASWTRRRSRSCTPTRSTRTSGRRWARRASAMHAPRRSLRTASPELMALAHPEAIFLHCLPAKRGEEVAAAVIDGPQSAVWRQSANRLPTEQALLLALTCGFEGQ